MGNVYLMGQVEHAAVAVVVLLVTLGVRRWILGQLAKAAEGNPKSFAAVAREGLSTPALLWCLMVSVDVLLRAIEVSDRMQKLGHNLVISCLILSLTLVASSVLMRGMQIYGEQKNLPFAVAGLSRTLIQAIAYSIGLLVLLRFLGISITPALTALGVGGLAVALALQDTLANLFAGVHILVERPIGVGDFVRLSADEEGTVSDIGWRTTRLLTGANSTVVIPNKTITSGILLNYSMPSAEVGTWVPVIVGFGADMETVEQIALEAAAGAEGVVAEVPPLLLADPGMTPTHLQYKLIFRVPAHTQAGPIKSRVVGRLLAGFRKAGVPMPEPRAR
jgi:small-conductance mechanosensitive channel